MLILATFIRVAKDEVADADIFSARETGLIEDGFAFWESKDFLRAVDPGGT